MIDLHCHSNYSDGVLSPEDLLAKAAHQGVSVLALTDHDTVEGLKQLKISQNLPQQLKLIPGIELSARWRKHDVHILGLHVDIESPDLTQIIQQQTASRKQRSLHIAEKMALIGVSDAFQKACDIAGHDRLSRPHFAQVLINEGLASDMQAAFKRYLGRGKAAYIETHWISVAEAVEVIHQSKGLAVIAHPLKYKLTRTKLHEFILDFKEVGGDALEVVSGEMTDMEVREVAGLSRRFGLMASTGSDFHAEGRSRISLGQQRQLPVECTAVWNQWNI